jgi:hypothetical protein
MAKKTTPRPSARHKPPSPLEKIGMEVEAMQNYVSLNFDASKDDAAQKHAAFFNARLKAIDGAIDAIDRGGKRA